MLEPAAPAQAEASGKAEASTAIVVVDIAPSLVDELTDPVYPADALAARLGDCVVYVTITIDASGSVSEVIPSWRRLNIPNRYSDDFLDAIRVAARSWKFEPARLVYWEKTRDEDLKYLYAVAVPAKTDVKVTFAAAGKVR
jgi:outer membrane biosynthesis protein TonB